ncbi:hypothetical protein TKK_0008843 [Trichogramma kaykai]|uniref:Tetraspanin n=1 Tax=Trichogramma kaykai TaxID=54128 RepID=A0ABD2X3D4_9HYME
MAQSSVEPWGLSLRCIKTLIVLVNILFVITGLLIILIGSTIYRIYDDYASVMDPVFSSPGTMLIVVGAIIFVIAFLGCCGALKESTCMVLTFAALLTTTLVVEVSAGITAFALKDRVTAAVSQNLNQTIHMYTYDEKARISIDLIQEQLRCCGFNGYNDWEEILQNTNSSAKVPQSCCSIRRHAGRTTYTPCSRIHARGCAKGMELVVKNSAYYLTTGAVVLALLQLGGILFAIKLGNMIRKRKTEREQRRWQMRESLLRGYQPIGKSDLIRTHPMIYMTASNTTRN